MKYFCKYSSPLGGITLAGNGESLTGLWFDGQKYFGRGLLPDASENDTLPVFELAKSWLDIYFSGRNPDFLPPIEFNASPFRKSVWEMLLRIPFGETVSYGVLAKSLAETLGLESMSAQAVGGAVGHNPVSVIVPCHRVVGANGSLTGYAGGVSKKAALLRLEGADMSKFTVPVKGTAI